MRKTLIAMTIGLTALAVAACGGTGTDTGASPAAPLESVDPMLESIDPMLESPSDMLLPSDSPASS